jgi:amidase
LAAREHDFLTSDLSHRALQARGMGLSTPDFMRQCLRQEWARFFEHIDVVLCSPAPTGPIRHDQKPDPHARSIEVNGNQN